MFLFWLCHWTNLNYFVPLFLPLFLKGEERSRWGKTKIAARAFFYFVSFPIVTSSLRAPIILQLNYCRWFVPVFTFKRVKKKKKRLFQMLFIFTSYSAPNLGFSCHLPVFLPCLARMFLRKAFRAVLGGDRRPQDVHSSRKWVTGDAVSPWPLCTPSFLRVIFIHHLAAYFPNTFRELNSLINFPNVHLGTFHCNLAMWLYRRETLQR